jgi:hypothetical protein
MPLQFEWDPEKAGQNALKHGVTFAEAEGVFADPVALEMADPDHSEEEDRWLIMGRTYRERILVVVFTERGSATRIISARRAARAEVRRYEEQERT